MENAQNPREPRTDAATFADETGTVAESSGASARRPPIPVQIRDHDLLRLIGQGSYGDVWLARNVMGTFRAVKVVHRASFDNARPFEREFNGIQKFEPVSRSHDGFIDVLHIGRTADSFHYVMELADDVVTGQQIDPDRYEPRTLRSDVASRKSLPIERCVEVGLALASSLGHLHAHGLIHRDIKPSNIIFVNGQPKLADIGLVAGQNEARSFVGTEGFIPPEGPGTPQADIFSLGKVLYEIATGKDRHEFPALPTLLGETPADTPLIELNTVLLKACQGDVRHRYQSCAEMRHDLLLLQSGKSVQRSQALERRWAVAKRIGAAAAALILLAFAALYQLDRQAAREAALRRESDHQRSLADQARRQADTNALASLRLAIQSHVATGNKLSEGGDPLAALPWWVEALRLEPDPNRAEMHRIRLSTALRQSPKPTWVWFHADKVLDIALHPGGDLVATASHDRTARLWSLQTGLPLTPPLSHSNKVEQVLFSPDGRWLLTRESERAPLADAAPDEGSGAINLWQIPDGRHLLRAGHSNVVSHAEFSADGRFWVTACSDHRARIWRTEDRILVQTLDHPREVVHASFSPDGRLLVTSCRDNRVRLWNLTDGRLQQTWDIPSDTWQVWNWKREAIFSRDGKRVFAINAAMIRAWDIHTNAPLFSIHSMYNNMIELDAHGGRLLTTDMGGAANIWSTTNGAPVVSLKTIPHHSSIRGDVRAHFSTDRLWMVAFGRNGVSVWDPDGGLAVPLNFPTQGGVFQARFSPDRRHLLLACGDGTARVWDLVSTEQGRPGFFHGGVMNRLRLSKDGNRLYLSSGRSEVFFWDARTGRKRVDPPPRHSPGAWGAWSMELSDDDRFLFAADRNGNARVYDAVTGAPIGPFLQHGRTNALFGTFIGDGSLLFTGDGRGTARLWEPTTGRILRDRVHAHPGNITFVQRIPGRPLVATAGGDGTARLWHASTLEPHGPVLHHKGMMSSLAVTPDGRQLAGGSWTDGTVILWDVETGAELRRWETPQHTRDLAFDGDGRRLAAAGADFFVRIWDLATGAPIQTIPCIETPARIRFSRDGRMVATGGTVGGQVWDASTGERLTPLLRVEDFARYFNDIQFSADGRYIAGGGNNTARIFDLTPEPWSLEQWTLLSRAVSGMQINPGGTAEPLDRASFSNAWHSARTQFPAQFTNSDAQVVHALLDQTAVLEPPTLLRGLLPPLNRLIDRHPDDPFWKQARALVHLRLGDIPAASQDDPRYALPPRDPRATPRQIDLSPHYNRLVTPGGLGDPILDLAELPRGLQQLGGTTFDIRGLIKLGSLVWGARARPDRVAGIRVAQKCQSLHFLHASEFTGNSRSLIARYVLHYADGETRELPVVAGRDIHDWWTGPSGEHTASDAICVWQADNHVAGKLESKLQMWKKTYANPRPEVEISRIDFVSALADPAPFLVALTVE